MAENPTPHQPGTFLDQRFHVQSVLGRGGFGIAYLALDQARNDQVVVKELAPNGVLRLPDGRLDLEALGSSVAHRIRNQFLEEAKLIAKLNINGIPNVRVSFLEYGTAYFASNYCKDAETLDALLRKNRRLDESTVLDFLLQIAETLSRVHQKKILHRDIKPSNILARTNGEALLIDFGAARQWHADITQTQTVLFTPGYAPLEQLSERGKRGPATDLYGLCATGYALFTGSPPLSPLERINGHELVPLHELRPDIDPIIANAIDGGLALYFEERPQTIGEWLKLMKIGPTAPTLPTVEDYDKRRLKLQKFSYGKHACPACKNILIQPVPLNINQCPVCTSGRLILRSLHPQRCPICRSGVLHALNNAAKPQICPLCSVGHLLVHSKGLLHRKKIAHCKQCKSQLTEEETQIWRVTSCDQFPERLDEVHTWLDWQTLSGRSTKVEICDGCDALFDLKEDGRWKQIYPQPEPLGYVSLYPEEWARVAARLKPGAGTHVCTRCQADFFIEGGKITLLDAQDDPFHFAEDNIGRLYTQEEVRWIGVGKESPHSGYVCHHCRLEFDEENGQLKLIQSNHPELRNHIGQTYDIQNWHRIAQGLPKTEDEAGFEKAFDLALITAYQEGQLDIDGKGNLWKGKATVLNDNKETTFVATMNEIRFGGLFRKEKIPVNLIEALEFDADHVQIKIFDELEWLEFELPPIQFSAPMSSGSRIVELHAADLASRLLPIVKTNTYPAELRP